MERKCIKCIHFPCLKVQCEAQNTEVCDLYETEVSRAIKKLKTEGYYDFERRKIGGNMKVEKVICDKCKKEIELKEYYYSLNSNITYGNYEIETIMLKKGDYCGKCFRGQFFKEEI